MPVVCGESYKTFDKPDLKTMHVFFFINNLGLKVCVGYKSENRTLKGEKEEV